jgi:hypothetical protein
MAKVFGHILFLGTSDGACFYRMDGKYYVRRASTLSRRRVKTSPVFKRTMQFAGMLGRASKIGSEVYRALPRQFREGWMYRAFTGEAFTLLKNGMIEEDVLSRLWNTYVSVWELKDKECDPPASQIITIRTKPGTRKFIYLRNTDKAGRSSKNLNAPCKLFPSASLHQMQQGLRRLSRPRFSPDGKVSIAVEFFCARRTAPLARQAAKKRE